LPPNTFGVFEDNDTATMNQSSWALAYPERIRNDLVDAARAVIAVEYLAGELRSSPRWSPMATTPKTQMLQARLDLRHVLGIRPDVSPQAVVNALLGVVAAPQAGNQPAALQALSAPIFMQPPPETFAVLTNLPYVKSAALASNSNSGLTSAPNASLKMHLRRRIAFRISLTAESAALPESTRIDSTGWCTNHASGGPFGSQICRLLGKPEGPANR
jgi:hypothetical protein